MQRAHAYFQCQAGQEFLAGQTPHRLSQRQRSYRIRKTLHARQLQASCTWPRRVMLTRLRADGRSAWR